MTARITPSSSTRRYPRNASRIAGYGRATTPRPVVSRPLDASDGRTQVETAPPWLQVAAGWSWRVMVVALAVVLFFVAIMRVQMIVVALFVGLILTSVLRPLVDHLAKVMPRPLATALSLVGAVLVVAGLFTYIGVSVADRWDRLSTQFNDGINEIADWISTSHLPIDSSKFTVQEAVQRGQEWLNENTGDLASRAFQGVGSVVEVFTIIALSIFLSVFFLSGGRHIWAWFLNQIPARLRPTWRGVGATAWDTFSGYTRGISIVAVSNGILAFIGLSVLKIPLAAPLGVLVFMGTFIPLIGAPAAMVVAIVVALAANGLWSAVAVGVLIALIGQFEGHVLQPLVMGKQVSLHPVVVALSVAGGTLVGGVLGAVVAVPIVSVAWAVFSLLRRVDPPTESVGPDGLTSTLTPGTSTDSASAKIS